MTTPQPNITILIAVRNAADTLDRCLDSIAAQTWPRRETVVIDGASTDGTKAILERRATELAFWCSEPDTGIGNAWNKGLRHARGDWVAFLGADDWYAASESLAGLAATIEGASGPLDLVSARARLIHGGISQEFGDAWAWERFRYRMNIAHPGALHRRGLWEELGPFDETLRIASDYEFLLRSGPRLRTAYVPLVAVNMQYGGVSTRNFERMLHDMAAAQIRSGALPAWRAQANRIYLQTRRRAKLGLRRLGLDVGSPL